MTVNENKVIIPIEPIKFLSSLLYKDKMREALKEYFGIKDPTDEEMDFVKFVVEKITYFMMLRLVKGCRIKTTEDPE